MDHLIAKPIGQMITANTRRSLDADWGIDVLDDRLLDDIGITDTVRWQNKQKKSWLDAVMAAISEPIGAAVRFTSF